MFSAKRDEHLTRDEFANMYLASIVWLISDFLVLRLETATLLGQGYKHISTHDYFLDKPVLYIFISILINHLRTNNRT